MESDQRNNWRAKNNFFNGTVFATPNPGTNVKLIRALYLSDCKKNAKKTLKQDRHTSPFNLWLVINYCLKCETKQNEQKFFFLKRLHVSKHCCLTNALFSLSFSRYLSFIFHSLSFLFLSYFSYLSVVFISLSPSCKSSV